MLHAARAHHTPSIESTPTRSRIMATSRLRFSYSQSRVHVYKDKVLGMGSFGTVCKAKVDDFICAEDPFLGVALECLKRSQL